MSSSIPPLPPSPTPLTPSPTPLTPSPTPLTPSPTSPITKNTEESRQNKSWQNKSWFQKISSCIGFFPCTFGFGTREKKSSHEGDPVNKSSSISTDSDGTDRVVKSYCCFFPSLDGGAKRNTFTTVTDDTPITCTNPNDPDNKSKNIILKAAGYYRIADPLNLANATRTLKENKPNVKDSEQDQKRGCLTIKNKKQIGLLEENKNKVFIKSVSDTFHQGALVPIPELFKNGNPPTDACFCSSGRDIDVKYEVNDSETSVNFTVTIFAHKATNTSLYAANCDTPVQALEKPSCGTTTMKVKGSLNEDGSLDIKSLECLSVEGSWQLGSRSKKKVSFTTTGTAEKPDHQVSVSQQGMNDILNKTTLEPVSETIKKPFTPSCKHSTFHADVERGYIHQGDDPTVTGKAFLEEFSKKIHSGLGDESKSNQLKKDLMNHCQQGLFAGIKDLKAPEGSLFVLGGKQGDVTTTFKYKHVSADDAGTTDYPYGKIELEVAQKVAQNGTSLHFLSEGKVLNLENNSTRNVSGTLFMKIDLKLNEDGGVATVDSEENTSSLNATILSIETSWQIPEKSKPIFNIWGSISGKEEKEYLWNKLKPPVR